MDLREYEIVKNMTYIEYCDYLQQKHGIGKYAYMTKSWNKNNKATRTKDGLLIHHKFEDHAIMLSSREYAMKLPFEWQLAENLVYCDYLEHLLLHVLICKFPSKARVQNNEVGVGGIVNFLVPLLNDIYSGWEPKKEWQLNCWNLIKNDKDVYMKILRQFIEVGYEKYMSFSVDWLLISYNEKYGVWSSKNNEMLFNEIKKMKF